MENKSLYGSKFYDTQSDSSYLSARATVPHIVKALKPKSVVDIGCGVGTWLKAFEEEGVEFIHGIDGPWVDRSRLRIRDDQFTAFDFSKETPPFHPALPREKVDMVITLEFAEHAPEQQAKGIIDFVSSITDMVVFGAAVPGQGGTGHINEQWPDYWGALLAPHGFEPFDFLRPLIWNDDRVESWYRQNTIGFFRNGVPEQARIGAEQAALESLRNPQRLIHPALFETKADNAPARLGKRFVKHMIGRR